MSLIKETCEKCWLPPDTGKTLCRKCTEKPQEGIQWIRYHRPSSSCKKFRALILSGKYFGSALPEDCIHCSNFLLSMDGWKQIMKDCVIFYPHEKITTLFRREIDCRKDALLDYISNLLSQFIDETVICRRILNALMDAANGRKNWILEELVQQPISYPSILSSPILIPYYLTEDFFESIEDMNVWWTFWEKMPEAARRRIRFRCMTFKEELLEKTWAPSRVKNWCLDVDEVFEIKRNWSH
jgi:hypothetical protein